MSTVKMLLDWEKTGKLTAFKDEQPWSFLVDCSVGTDPELRGVAEESLENMLRVYDKFPVILMMLRILDERAKYNRHLRKELPPDSPDATDFINFLGDILHESHPFAYKVLDDLDEKCLNLAVELEAAGENPAVVDLLRRSDLTPDPVHRLSEAMVNLSGANQQGKHFMSTLDALLMTNSSHGMCRKRSTLRKNREGRQTRGDARSIVLSNSMLDFLVHRHLRKAAKGKGPQSLSIPEFLKLLRERYGLYVDEPPPEMSISAELLARNKKILERRLRDLGLLVGVNDSESMKRLRQRFIGRGGDNE